MRAVCFTLRIGLHMPTSTSWAGAKLGRSGHGASDTGWCASTTRPPARRRTTKLCRPRSRCARRGRSLMVRSARSSLGSAARIPSIAAFRENIEAGALISYGFDLMGLFYDITSYVHQIARGAKPSDMPIEQSPRFYMAVNLKAAASLGISLSDVFVARANEVRE